jgi:integrase
MKTNIDDFIDHLMAQVTKNTNSLNAYRKAAREFIEFIGDKNTVTQTDIDKYLVHIAERFSHNSGINMVSGLRHFLRWNGYDIRRKNERKSRGFLVKIPKAKATRNTKNDFLTDDEIQRMYDVAKIDPYLNAMTRVFFETWQRISSILALNVKDIDFELKTITFWKMKRGELRPQPHTVPIDDETTQVLKTYLNGRTDGPVFLNKTRPTRLNDNECRHHLKELSVRARIPPEKNVIPHMARRSGITNHKKKGMQDSDIMKISGHDDIHSLKSYDCTDIEDIRNIINRYKQQVKPTEQPKLDPEKEQLFKTIEQLTHRLEKLEAEKTKSEHEKSIHASIYG